MDYPINQSWPIYPSNVDVAGLVSEASNIVVGDNPSFALTDFLAIYPQFGQDASSNWIVPSAILTMFMDIANHCIFKEQWGEQWNYVMCLFIAHFATIHLMGSANANSGAGAVLAAGKARGVEVSKSVESVSVGLDYNAIAQDLNGWAGWKLTVYGTQLATLARLVGKGGMYVY